MKRILYPLFYFIIFSFLVAQKSFADVSVNVSGNASGSNAQVSVKSVVQSSTTQRSTSTSHTKVHIESNGEVKDYESDNGGNVNLESSDGHARVQITEHSVSLSASPTPSVTISPAQILVEDKKKLQEKVKGLQAKIQEKNRNFFQRILSFFRNLFFHR